MSTSPTRVRHDAYRETLLGHLTLRFATHPENLATEALAYILRRSRAARQRLAGIVRSMGAEIAVDDILTYDTQFNTGQYGIPDLVAYREDRSVALIVEVKFGAPFTKNQPWQYLKSLPLSASAFLFLVPNVRVRGVWARCQGYDNDLALGFQQVEAAHPLARRAFAGRHSVGVISWQDLMSELDESLRADQDPQPLADLQQLWGLVRNMEEQVLVPFTEDDLKPEHGRTYFQFVRLVDKLADQLAAKFGQAGTKGRLGSYGRTFQRYGIDWYFVVSPRLWARSAEWPVATPLWLALSEPGSKSSEKIRRALAGLENLDPPGLYDYSPREVVIPLLIPPEKDEEGVLDHLVKQIDDVTARLERYEEPR